MGVWIENYRLITSVSDRRSLADTFRPIQIIEKGLEIRDSSLSFFNNYFITWLGLGGLIGSDQYSVGPIHSNLLADFAKLIPLVNTCRLKSQRASSLVTRSALYHTLRQCGLRGLSLAQPLCPLSATGRLIWIFIWLSIGNRISIHKFRCTRTQTETNISETWFADSFKSGE